MLFFHQWLEKYLLENVKVRQKKLERVVVAESDLKQDL
jgi:hypothetical protein